jgi:hypothetical protein
LDALPDIIILLRVSKYSASSRECISNAASSCQV